MLAIEEQVCVCVRTERRWFVTLLSCSVGFLNFLGLQDLVHHLVMIFRVSWTLEEISLCRNPRLPLCEDRLNFDVADTCCQTLTGVSVCEIRGAVDSACIYERRGT